MSTTEMHLQTSRRRQTNAPDQAGQARSREGKRVRPARNDAEKTRIIAQTWAPGLSAAQVERRHDLNANLTFKWLRDPRFSSVQVPRIVFLPVTIAVDPPAMKISGRPVTANAEVSLEITPPGDCTARVDVVRLCARIRGLEQ